VELEEIWVLVYTMDFHILIRITSIKPPTFQKPADILNGIVEKGPMFSKTEYEAILRLLNRSDPNTNMRTLNANLEKLSEIIQKVGVAV
jgi:hypothetical protein